MSFPLDTGFLTLDKEGRYSTMELVGSKQHYIQILMQDAQPPEN